MIWLALGIGIGWLAKSLREAHRVYKILDGSRRLP
jgi:hypothetical protein